MYHVQKLCKHALWMHHGSIQRYGPAADVTTEYLVYHEEKSTLERQRAALHHVSASGLYSVTGFRLASDKEPAGSGLHRHKMGDALTVTGELRSPDGRTPGVSIGIVRLDGTPVYGVVSEAERYAPTRIDAQHFAFRLSFPALPLLPGKYTVRAHAMDPEGMRLCDTVERELFVEGATRELGLCRLDHQWGDAEAKG